MLVQRAISSQVRFVNEQADVQSSLAHIADVFRRGDDVRHDKVAAIKAAIKSGEYESDEKLDIAADRLLDDLLR
jgi:anti-sigma28 factor (negative regulator of flagellin synthesis)